MKHYRVTSNGMIGVHSRGKLISFGIMFEIRKDEPASRHFQWEPLSRFVRN